MGKNKEVNTPKKEHQQGKECGEFSVPVLSSRCCFLCYDQIKIPTNGIKGGKCYFIEGGSRNKGIR